MKFVSQNYYEILDVDPGASDEEVKRAYRLVRSSFEPESMAIYSLYSPEETESIGAKIDEAFRILTNRDRRRVYDKYLHSAAPEAPTPPDPDAFFDNVHDIHELTPLEEFVQGADEAGDGAVAHAAVEIDLGEPPIHDDELRVSLDGMTDEPTIDEPASPGWQDELEEIDYQPIAFETTRYETGDAPGETLETAAATDETPAAGYTEGAAAPVDTAYADADTDAEDEPSSYVTADFETPDPVAVHEPTPAAPQPAAPQPAAPQPAAYAPSPVAEPAPPAVPPSALGEPQVELPDDFGAVYDEEVAPVAPESVAAGDDEQRAPTTPRLRAWTREFAEQRGKEDESFRLRPIDDAVLREVRRANAFDGAVLRKLRKERGVPLNTISERTKISIMYLRFIEQDTYENLPAPIYLKGFVDQYARLLDLPDDMVERYMDHYKRVCG